MDIREKFNSEETAFYNAFWGQMKSVWTANRVVVQSSDGHKTTVQSAVNGRYVDPVTLIETTGAITPFSDVPIHHTRGGGVSHTVPTVAGDEGVVVFANVAIDSWFQNGGTNNDPIDGRTHHVSDASFISGGNSVPMKLNPAASQTSSQIRSDDGNHVRDLHPANGLTSASTVKHLISVGGVNGTATLHGLQDVIVNGVRTVLLQTVQAKGLPPPGLAIANAKLIDGDPLPAIGGQMTSVMSSALSGGAASVFTNPAAAAITSLSSLASSWAAGLTSALGGAAATLVAALTGSGGLAASLTALATGTSSMSGATSPTSGNYGLADVISHLENATTFFGASPPPSVAPATVTAPLQCSSQLSAYETQIGALVQAVINGDVSVASGTAQVSAITAGISALLPAANAAIATLQAAAPTLSLALAAASAAVGQDPNLAALGSLLAGANSNLSTLAAGALAIITPTEDELTSATNFPDPSSSQQGARGGR